LNHLQKYMEIMAERRENLEGKLEYYHLHWPRNSTFFERGPKILSIRKCVEPTFIYSELETYVMMAINVIKTNRLDLKYLSALLNSKLEAFWLYHMGKMQGNNYQIDKEPLLAIPIYKPSIQEQQSVISLVDQILAITKSEDYQNSPAKQAKVKELERRIDQMVYELYGLTPEEIEVVEGTFKK
jgi:adenine-specific DNA-methyltransferase